MTSAGITSEGFTGKVRNCNFGLFFNKEVFVSAAAAGGDKPIAVILAGSALAGHPTVKRNAVFAKPKRENAHIERREPSRHSKNPQGQKNMDDAASTPSACQIFSGAIL